MNNWFGVCRARDEAHKLKITLEFVICKSQFLFHIQTFNKYLNLEYLHILWKPSFITLTPYGRKVWNDVRNVRIQTPVLHQLPL
jgi:hypothetical protein